MAIPYQAEIVAAAKKYRLDPALLAGLVKQESGFNPKIRSPAGATGLTQLMPSTASGLGVKDATNPVQALDGGAKYLRQQLDAFGGSVPKALAAYNAGPGAVKKYGGVPPYAETQNYVRVVQANAAGYRKDGLNGTNATVVAGDTSTPPETGLKEDDNDGGGMFAPIFSGMIKALLWIGLVLGGAALVVLGAGRIATSGATG